MKMKRKTILLTGFIVLFFLTTNFLTATEEQKATHDNEPNGGVLLPANLSNLSIKIITPHAGSLYILDKRAAPLPLGRIRVIGQITIQIQAFDNTSGIKFVEIFIDGVLKARLPGPYYEWMLNEPLIARHTIKAVAFSTAGANASDECAITILCLGRLPPAPSSPEVGLANQSNTDGYNYYRYNDHVGDFVYNQLWYFNFLDDRGTSDPSDDIAGVAAYGLANPENRLTGGGLTDTFGMIVRDPAEGSSFPLFSENYDPTIPGNFYASESFEPGDGPEFQNPSGTIDVLSPDRYHITGQVANGTKEIKWDLYYQRGLGKPWLPWVHWPVPKTLDVIPAWITYHMQMANAIVNGTFYVRDGANETTYELNGARGYHDGFYSEFVFSIFEWNWIDFKQENLSVHLLYPHAPVYSCQDGWMTCTPGNLRVVYNNSEGEKEYNFYRGCDFDRNEINISYGELAVDPRYPDVKYPTQVFISAEDDDGNTLELQWSLLRYMIVYFDVPDPFYDTVTFEIIANFSGTFYDAGTGTTVPIAGPGWSDWSGQAFPEH